jgi:hypothetical protein
MQRSLEIALRFVCALGPLVACLAGGCSGSATADAGADAPIDFELPDAGPPPFDGGPPDGGGICADLSLVPFGTPALPPECLPRCSAETRDAIAACAGLLPCVRAAQNADTTPPVNVETRYGLFTIACGTAPTRPYPCELWQEYSCFEEFCRAEFYAYADCLDTGAMCTMERDVVNACMSAIPEAVTCLGERTAACFPAGP